MNMFELGTRLTGNRLTKITNIGKKIVDTKQAYSFYSTYDECGYVYPGYSLYDAIKEYEKDTKWQAFTEIQYFTMDPDIKDEYQQMPPF